MLSRTVAIVGWPFSYAAKKRPLRACRAFRARALRAAARESEAARDALGEDARAGAEVLNDGLAAIL